MGHERSCTHTHMHELMGETANCLERSDVPLFSINLDQAFLELVFFGIELLIEDRLAFSLSQHPFYSEWIKILH